MRPFVPPATLRYIYNALEQPHFNYCSVVWEIAVKRNQISYKNFRSVPCRIVASSSYDADAGCLLQQLGWKDLIAQRQIQEALMVFKLYIIWLDYLSSVFTERIGSGYAIRDSTNKLAALLPRTNRALAIEVKLPCDLRRGRSSNRFRQLLNRHIN